MTVFFHKTKSVR